MGVTVGDVTGHGAEASPHADAVREVLANMDEVDRNSPDWLDSLNARLTEQLDDDHFCAAISVRLDRSNSSDTLEANIAVAGMPAPMIVRKSGQIEWLQGGSLPLGVEDEALFVPDTATCLLHAGDKLVIFSDGVSEAHADDRELFGIHRVERVSSSLSAASGSEIIKGLLAAVRNHMSGQTPLDDMTVAVIENIASEQQTGRQAA
jgi:serine phosphatase RsbU (regulator of sigma subunit)